MNETAISGIACGHGGMRSTPAALLNGQAPRASFNFEKLEKAAHGALKVV